ncbi:hypothetical protein AD006_29320 (plasmid) [Pseudonocardia sp. EC080610-09]|uniref:hypothetical protein n=1 Tax=unclassified Pseudonocardia TaxID=2619320 RepID=UPI000706B8AD|nr:MULTISPECIES: hypothetical protein [unclassified Pseudonocardia]ALL79383.1 hypothetical protein AD006_29320 [Pseudonocardia sp. EC080610-09]ALL85663.1 hypothetical protein AD017_31935 [Pseudonocardia sp. EC080619-01]
MVAVEHAVAVGTVLTRVGWEGQGARDPDVHPSELAIAGTAVALTGRTGAQFGLDEGVRRGRARWLDEQTAVNPGCNAHLGMAVDPNRLGPGDASDEAEMGGVVHSPQS